MLGVWALVFSGPFYCWGRCGYGSGESPGDSRRILGLVNQQWGLEGSGSGEKTVDSGEGLVLVSPCWVVEGTWVWRKSWSGESPMGFVSGECLSNKSPGKCAGILSLGLEKKDP